MCFNLVWKKCTPCPISHPCWPVRRRSRACCAGIPPLRDRQVRGALCSATVFEDLVSALCSLLCSLGGVQISPGASWNFTFEMDFNFSLSRRSKFISTHDLQIFSKTALTLHFLGQSPITLSIEKSRIFRERTKVSWLPYSTYLNLYFHLLCSMTKLKEHNMEIC